MKTESSTTTTPSAQPDRDGLVLDVVHQGQRLGSLHCINLARPSEPERLGWFAKNADGTATGASWPTREEAAYDVFAWADGKPGREKEVLYLPPLAAGTVATCTAMMVYRRRVGPKVHCRLFKYDGLTPDKALRELIEQPGTEGRKVRITVEVLPIGQQLAPAVPVGAGLTESTLSESVQYTLSTLAGPKVVGEAEVITMLRGLSLAQARRIAIEIDRRETSHQNNLKQVLVALTAPTPATGAAGEAGKDGQGAFQRRIAAWMQETFGPEVSADFTERGFRFGEEAIELLQANGTSKADILKLVDYVYSRPVGELAQEVGGTMVTLAALCEARGIELASAAFTELQRCEHPEVRAKIQAKQEAKRARMIATPLPGIPAA